MKLSINHLLAVLLAVIAFKMWFPGKTPDNTEAIKAFDKVIEAKDESLRLIREWKDSEVQRGVQKDSLLAVSFTEHQKTYKPIYENLSKIGPRVDAIVNNDDELRAAYKKRFD